MDGPACIPNIGLNERRRRLHVGLVAALTAVALLVLSLALDWRRAWRLVVALPLWVAMLGILQHRGKT